MNALDVELYHPARLSRSNAKYCPLSRLCARNHEFISKNILKCRGTTFYSSSTFIRVPLVKQSTRIDTTAYRVLCTKIKGSAMRNISFVGPPPLGKDTQLYILATPCVAKVYIARAYLRAPLRTYARTRE